MAQGGPVPPRMLRVFEFKVGFTHVGISGHAIQSARACEPTVCTGRRRDLTRSPGTGAPECAKVVAGFLGILQLGNGPLRRVLRARGPGAGWGCWWEARNSSGCWWARGPHCGERPRTRRSEGLFLQMVPHTTRGQGAQSHPDLSAVGLGQPLCLNLSSQHVMRAACKLSFRRTSELPGAEGVGGPGGCRFPTSLHDPRPAFHVFSRTPALGRPPTCRKGRSPPTPHPWHEAPDGCATRPDGAETQARPTASRGHAPSDQDLGASRLRGHGDACVVWRLLGDPSPCLMPERPRRKTWATVLPAEGGSVFSQTGQAVGTTQV